jgi:hypothetical protein
MGLRSVLNGTAVAVFCTAGLAAAEDVALLIGNETYRKSIP